MDNDPASLTKHIETLQGIYGQYRDRHGKPLSLPSSIKNRYQSLSSDPAPSQNEVSDFTQEVQQNIADFIEAEKVSDKTNRTLDLFSMNLLKLGMKSELPVNIKAIDASYFDIIESDTFTGGDLLTYHLRYQMALSDYTEDAFKALEARQTVMRLGRKLDINAAKLASADTAGIAKDTEKFIAAMNEAEDLTKQQKWSAATHEFEQVLILANQLATKIEEKLVQRHATKVTELEALNTKINRLEKRIEGYADDFKAPCQKTIVDYSCAEQCPERREWDVIFNHYKNVPDYPCLSQCNNAQQEKQASFDQEQAACFDEKRRIKSKGLQLISERDSLLNNQNRLLDELQDLSRL
ncbi:hypothetical protein MDMS009_236 [Methylophaga thiooxydans DMS010]|uniref:Uncharacterized protein n=2 Tax=Methylophaga thiooxydans TaxID=392484 RepID=C0N1Z0_9GAMM|nr:hypothetical protein MDMS009_236 [Methylophaga thiooxydans DMS010]